MIVSATSIQGEFLQDGNYVYNVVWSRMLGDEDVKVRDAKILMGSSNRRESN